MKAKEGVLEFLNKILTAELTAVHQYIAHAAMCDNWGYDRLHHEIHERALEEVKHAEGIVEHILYVVSERKPDCLSLAQVFSSVLMVNPLHK